MLPIINILLIVGILLFILYNLYVDTRNWSNTGSFLEGMGNQFDLPLVSRIGIRVPWNPKFRTPSTRGGTASQLGRCEGDCDNDNECIGDLKCFQRGTRTRGPWHPVDQCTGRGKKYWDYCYDPHPQVFPGWKIIRDKSIQFSGRTRGANDKDIKGKSVDDALNIAYPLNSGEDRGLIWAIERNEKQQWTIFRTRKEDGSIPEHTLVQSDGWGVHMNPNEPFNPNPVADIIYKTITKLTDFCGNGETATTKMEWKGKDCGDGKIKWQSMKSVEGRRPGLTAQQCSWERSKTDFSWNNRYMGQCGVAPTYMSALPTTKGGLAAGSAGAAMGSQVSKRAGAVSPMEESRAQLCKPGCKEPTKPSGNCKVVNIEGKEMRDCPYKCDNFDLAPGKCQYDQDCNACGNKRFEPEKQPTMENMETMEESNISSEELTGEKDSGYRGKQNKTRSGKDCQYWNKQDPHSHSIQMNPAKGIGAHNYCRNPDGEPTIWCYTTDPGTRWEHCDPLPKQDLMPENVNPQGSPKGLFNEDIMKEVLARKDLIPDDVNKNNEEASCNLRIGKKFMIDAATIRNYALPNIDNQDYIELGRIVKSIKMRENDPQEGDQVKALYTKLNTFVLDLLNDSSLGMSDYYSRGAPKQINNKTRTTGMFGENSNSLITDTDTVKQNVKRQKVKPYNSIWTLYQ